jgi:hypothetical protein
LHPAEHRGLRELFATARQLRAHWLDLAGSLEASSGGVGAAELRAGSDSARELLHDLTVVCAERGLGGRPAAQGLGTRIAGARSALVDATLEANQALRLAVLDVQHVVTLLDYLARLAAERGDDELRSFLDDWSACLAVHAQAVRDTAVALGDDPDAAIAVATPGLAGRAGHGLAAALGTVGEWVDGRAAR